MQNHNKCTGRNVMNELEKQLIFIYTAIALVLALLTFIIPFRKKFLMMARKQQFLLVLFVLIFVPIFGFGFFCIFVNAYSFAKYATDNDFGTVQLIANVFNFILLYNFITMLRDKNE